MPYIKRARRPEVRPHADRQAMTPGELNYQFTMLARKYVQHHGLTYASINDVLGALEGAKLEFYRRVAMPYEDTKISENGDVYP